MEAGSWIVEGIGEDFVPDNCDLRFVRRGDAYAVSDQESVEAARELLAKAGVLGGSSSGTLFATALRFCRAQTEPLRVATFVCDSGDKYLSKVFNDHWLAGGPDEGGVVAVAPDDTLDTAYKRMRTADVSQLPVMDDGRLIGLIDESDLLDAVDEGRTLSPADRDRRFRRPVSAAMTAKLSTLQAREPLEHLIPIFERDQVAIVMDGRDFLGLITRVDLLNHLRRAA